MKPTHISEDLGIVIPVYRPTKALRLLLEQLHETLSGFCSYHVYLIDDSGQEAASAYLKKYCQKKQITLVTLTRNFGQQAAILCGLTLACHHFAVLTMDDDLQHPPELIPKLYSKLQEGFDLVYAIQEEPSGNLLRKTGSLLRDRLFSALFFGGTQSKVSSFRIMSREIAEKTAFYQGSFFYFSAVALRKKNDGSLPKKASLFYKKPSRLYGKSGYTLRKLILLFGRLFLHYGPLAPITNYFQKEYPSLYEIKHVSPTLMILGGSNCQLHALLRAKERSITTILADYTKNPPAKKFAGVHEPISTFDAPACIEAGKKYSIDGVMTLGTDQPVLTAALTANALSLPGCLSIEQARSVTNKKIMKQILAKTGIKTASFLFVSENGEFFSEKGEPCPFSLKPPYVLKPLDSQGQRGVFKLNTKEEILFYLPETLSFSREQTALVEEFYESDEITISGWLAGGQLTILTITDRLLYPDSTHIGVCIGHRFPSVHISRYEEIREICHQLTAAFTLKEGPFYLQLLVGKEGIFVNELACRIGGAFEDVTIPWLTGFSILDAVIDKALGYPVTFPLKPEFRCDMLEKASFVLLLFCRPGKIAHITPRDELLSLPYVLDCGFNYEEGSQIPAMENATARFGHAVLTGTKKTLVRNITDFYNHIEVLDENGINLIQTFNKIFTQENMT